jgi:hypothetical protein
MLLNKVSAVQLRKLMNGKELPRRRELIRRIAALVVSGILSRNETRIKIKCVNEKQGMGQIVWI